MPIHPAFQQHPHSPLPLSAEFLKIELFAGALMLNLHRTLTTGLVTGLVTGLIAGSLAPAALAQTAALSALAQQHPSLRQAICLQDWNQATQALGPLIAANETPAAERAHLVSWRYQLADYASSQVRFAPLEGCGAILSAAQTAAAEQARQEAALAATIRPISWDIELATLEQRLAQTPTRVRLSLSHLPQPSPLIRLRSSTPSESGSPCRSRLSLCQD